MLPKFSRVSGSGTMCVTSCNTLVVQFEEAARDVADEVTRPRPEGEEPVQDIQVMLTSAAHPTNVRSLKVWNVSIKISVLEHVYVSSKS